VYCESWKDVELGVGAVCTVSLGKTSRSELVQCVL